MAIIKLLYLIKDHILSIVGAVVLGTLGHICAILIPVLGVYYLYHQPFIGWLLLLFSLLRAILRYSEQYLNHLVAFKVLASIRSQLFRKLRALTPQIMESKDRGNLLSMMSSDVELLEVFFAHTISPILIAVLVSVFVYYVSPYPMITLVSHLLVGFILPSILYFLTEGLGKKYRFKFSELSELTYEFSNHYETLRSFNQVEIYESKMNQKSKELSNVAIQMAMVESITQILNEAILWGGAILLVFFKGENSSLLSLALVLHLSSFGPSLSLSALIQNLYHTFASAQRVTDLLQEPVLIETVENGIDLDGIKNLNFENIDFSYDGSNKVIDEFTLDVKGPKVIGVSGPSGCGKSTLIKLLARYFDPTSGKIKIEEHDLAKINSSSLKSSTSYMSQDTMIFNRSILDNVLIAQSDKSKEDVIAACKMAHIHEFIMSLDDGYETILDHHGLNLSSGERQRIALARVFLHDGDLILLDEISSNLDYLNERMIMSSLHSLKHSKIIFIISHRPLDADFTDVQIQMS